MSGKYIRTQQRQFADSRAKIDKLRANYAAWLAKDAVTPKSSAVPKKKRKRKSKRNLKGWPLKFELVRWNRCREDFWKLYNKYLESPEWLGFRARVLMERGHMCERCASRKPPFHLHHMTYKHLGNELPQDMQVLCVPCHEEHHKRPLKRNSLTSRP